MPQMAPMNWTILFLYFICVFLLFNTLNYYMLNYKISYTKKNFSHKSKMNWKW